MGESETDDHDAAPLFGGQTYAASLVPPNDAELLRRADLQAFVGPNLEKFLPLAASKGGRRRFPFCWPGFCFPPAWFMYRKMYGWAALVCALPIFATVMDFGVLQRPMMGASSFIGLVGRFIYAARARGAVARVRADASGRSEDDVRQTLARAGGVSTAGAVVGGAITFCAFVAGVVAGYHAQRH
jgi:hypothetical protein